MGIEVSPPACNGSHHHQMLVAIIVVHRIRYGLTVACLSAYFVSSSVFCSLKILL
jgi:hypothetical protein